MLKSPKDPTISARQEYRTLLKRNYDLVLIENGYPLEPNYVIVDGIPVSYNIDEIRRLNL